MELYGGLGILILLIIITGSESAVPVVKVKFNGTAVLPCSERCSGVARWTVSHKSSDTLAECDQTSCRSVKEGYQMIYNQYLQGDLSLIITEADLSKRGYYTCDCDGRDKCDVHLQIEDDSEAHRPDKEKPKPGSESDVLVVKVKNKGTAVLPCSERCSRVASWTPFHKSTDVLVECDQTSCRSVKEGYQMIYNQYLQGDLSLIITEADFSKRGHYTCDCDGRDQGDVHLQIEALKTSVQIQSGGSLVMKLEVSDPVEVIYNSTGSADGSSVQICTVIGRSLQCKPEYVNRTSLLSSSSSSSSSSVLELGDMKESDSGVYTIRDSRNKEDIHIYTINRKDSSLSPWGIVFIVFLLVVVLVLMLLVCKFVLINKRDSNKRDIQDLEHNLVENTQETQNCHKTIEELKENLAENKRETQKCHETIQDLERKNQEYEDKTQQQEKLINIQSAEIQMLKDKMQKERKIMQQLLEETEEHKGFKNVVNPFLPDMHRSHSSQFPTVSLF